MHIYFSGIGGVGLGPLAELAKDAGHEVSGSDLSAGLMTSQLKKHGIEAKIGQTGKEIAAVHTKKPIDWLVVSSAIPPDHPEVIFAQKNQIRISKRDELIGFIIKQKNLQLIAIAGTHGKTTTTAMMAWLFKQFDMPISYSVGTTISFGPSGKYDAKSEYFIYEADEYDRNMLNFAPDYTLITSVDYDHPDTYPKVEDYKQAFKDLINQSNRTYAWLRDLQYLGQKAKSSITVVDQTICNAQANLNLYGEHNRQNATLAMACFVQLFPEYKIENVEAAMNLFPGTTRRFEKLADNIYTDYAHHPAEIAAMVQLAREISDDVVVVYQPHQNLRQHQIKDEYKTCFNGAEHVYWLPTYLSREDPEFAVLQPEDLIKGLNNPQIAEPAKLDKNLVDAIRKASNAGKLVLAMGAGSIDGWLRDNLNSILKD